MTEKTTTEKATTEQSVDQLIREIVVSNDKGKKYEAASGQHWDKAWQMYIVAGIDLAKLKVLTGGGAPWMAAYTEKCGLKKSWVNTLISLGNGTTMVPQLRMQTAERVKKHRAKKAEQAKQEAKVTAGEAKATVTVTADQPTYNRYGHCEPTLLHLQWMYQLMDKDTSFAARAWMTVTLTEYKKHLKAAGEAAYAAAMSAPTAPRASQQVFDSPQEAHQVDEPYPGHAALTAKKAAAKAAKKAAADAEQVAA